MTCQPLTLDLVADEWLQAHDAQVDVPRRLRSGYVPRRQGSHRDVEESRLVSENKDPHVAESGVGGAKYVYDFAEGNRDLKDLLGGKGANLAEMTRLGLPVPPGFTITTEACRAYLAERRQPDELGQEIDAHLRQLEDAMGKRLGDADDLRGLVSAYKRIFKDHTGRDFPQEPRDQLELAILAVFDSWNADRAVLYRRQERIPADLGTAVNVVAMVFGNTGGDSGTGVAFTRDPGSGEQGVYGDYLANAQGEDVVAGIRNTVPLQNLEQLDS